MATFRLSINIDGAAFYDYDDPTPGSELARILRRLAERMAQGDEPGGKLRDIYGNTVGHYEITEE
jgi:hypothetical protein